MSFANILDDTIKHAKKLVESQEMKSIKFKKAEAAATLAQSIRYALKEIGVHGIAREIIKNLPYVDKSDLVSELENDLRAIK